MNQQHQIVGCFDLESADSIEQMNDELRSRGVSLNIDTFLTDAVGRWQMWSSFHPGNKHVMNSFAGNKIDLGGGSWTFACTASGLSSTGRPVSTSYLFEYDAPSDTLSWTAYFGKIVLPGASNEASPIQIRTNSPPLLLVRARRVQIDNEMHVEVGSYLQIGN